jgi:hypothetical protein
MGRTTRQGCCHCRCSARFANPDSALCDVGAPVRCVGWCARPAPEREHARQVSTAASDLTIMGFDEDELDFDFDDDIGSGTEPDFRATVRRSGAVRIVYWGGWLSSSGPIFTLIDSRARAGVGIADLKVVRDHDGLAAEVIVDFLSGGGADHRGALCRWAAATGYSRAWFDGEVLDLTPSPGGLVQTRCTGCGQRFVDGRSGHFWDQVRRAGVFPASCGVCGSDLPQWTPVERSEGARATSRFGAARHRFLDSAGTGTDEAQASRRWSS